MQCCSVFGTSLMKGLVQLPQLNKIHSLVDNFYYRTTTAVAFHHALMKSYLQKKKIFFKFVYVFRVTLIETHLRKALHSYFPLCCEKQHWYLKRNV